MSHRFVTRVADYEPAPVPASLMPPSCRVPRPAALHQHSRAHPAGVGHGTHHHEPSPSPQAVAFADAALRRVFEALDRRRPIAQLRPLLADGPMSAVLARAARSSVTSSTRLQQIRVRACGHQAAEIFGTYHRAGRVGAIAGRIEHDGQRWLVVALQIG